MKCIVGIIFTVIIVCFTLSVTAVDTPTEAEELSVSVSSSDGDAQMLRDRDEVTYTNISDGGTVVISSDRAISSLYILFDHIYGEWTLSDGVTSVVCGENSFLHEYVDVKESFGYAPKSLTMTFSHGSAQLSEIFAFAEGEMPSWVQIWEPPCKDADLMLTSTHIDDEQLFFAGILPYYAGELGLDVQVVYFTDPFKYHDRPHEQLNGLWTVGVRHYPVSGEFVDEYSETSKDAYAHQKKHGFTRDDMISFQVRMIRRFRPHVIVGHDINGEYSHGQHIINCETLMEALTLAADGSFDPESVREYGVWDTPKTYIHLWEENPIVMDWDQPLESFGGKTAFQVSQDGFRCHKSQQWTWFRRWIYGKNNEITKATEIKKYSPCLYGLFRTTVGLDAVGGDMFENIPQSYAEIRAEELRREEEESRAESERVSLEESLAESERQRLEEESRRAEESSSDAPVTEADTEGIGGSGDDPRVLGVAMVAAVAAVAALLIIPQIETKKRRRKGPRHRSQ